MKRRPLQKKWTVSSRLNMISGLYESESSAPNRKSFGDIVRLEADVVEAFSDVESVNEALPSESLVKLKKVDNG